MGSVTVAVLKFLSMSALAPCDLARSRLVLMTDALFRNDLSSAITCQAMSSKHIRPTWERPLELGYPRKLEVVILTIKY